MVTIQNCCNPLPFEADDIQCTNLVKRYHDELSNTLQARAKADDEIANLEDRMRTIRDGCKLCALMLTISFTDSAKRYHDELWNTLQVRAKADDEIANLEDRMRTTRKRCKTLR